MIEWTANGPRVPTTIHLSLLSGPTEPPLDQTLPALSSLGRFWAEVERAADKCRHDPPGIECCKIAEVAITVIDTHSACLLILEERVIILHRHLILFQCNIYIRRCLSRSYMQFVTQQVCYSQNALTRVQLRAHSISAENPVNCCIYTWSALKRKWIIIHSHRCIST